MPLSVKIFIVEDDKLLSNDLRGHLEELGHWVVGIAEDSESAYEKISDVRPDVILMDIDIKGSMNGIELSEKLIADNITSSIIYLTANDDDESFRKARLTSPFDFLSKPVGHRRLKRSLDLAISQLEETTSEVDRWVVKEGGTIYKVALSDLIVVEAKDKYCHLQLKGGLHHMIRMSLSEVKMELSDGPFIQVHRSFLINRNQILKYNTKMNRLTMLDNHDVPVSKSFKQALLDMLK